jgi:hypothetical protein
MDLLFFLFYYFQGSSSFSRVAIDLFKDVKSLFSSCLCTRTCLTNSTPISVDWSAVRHVWWLIWFTCDIEFYWSIEAFLGGPDFTHACFEINRKRQQEEDQKEKTKELHSLFRWLFRMLIQQIDNVGCIYVVSWNELDLSKILILSHPQRWVTTEMIAPSLTVPSLFFSASF